MFTQVKFDQKFTNFKILKILFLKLDELVKIVLIVWYEPNRSEFNFIDKNQNTENRESCKRIWTFQGSEIYEIVVIFILFSYRWWSIFWSFL